MLKQALIAVAVLIAFTLLLVFNDDPREVRYDCSISEFHPDYPKEVKEQCRKLRSSKAGFV